MKSLSVFILASVLLFSISVNAQSKIRLQAGINLANVSVTSDGRIDRAHELTRFQVGLVGDTHIGSILYFQPGLVFTGKGSKVESGDPSSQPYYKATANPFYIEMPLNFVFKLPLGGENKLFAGAGPYVAMGISGKNTVDGNFGPAAYHSEKNIQFSNDDPTTLNNEEGAGFGIMKRFDYGFNGTAGIEGKSLAIGVNYGLGLAKLQSGSNSAQDNNNKHRVISIVLGIKL